MNRLAVSYCAFRSLDSAGVVHLLQVVGGLAQLLAHGGVATVAGLHLQRRRGRRARSPGRWAAWPPRPCIGGLGWLGARVGPRRGGPRRPRARRRGRRRRLLGRRRRRRVGRHDDARRRAPAPSTAAAAPRATRACVVTHAEVSVASDGHDQTAHDREAAKSATSCALSHVTAGPAPSARRWPAATVCGTSSPCPAWTALRLRHRAAGWCETPSTARCRCRRPWS